ncbi:biliverdin-producing heme oxygenase [Marichromatium gracile]|uniref:biliverdin-producing heme oxygenase n=1 Tax=Marichromatium gracile TaxID=1048 RepID=UPI001F383695|nr:biliverdin-producing heme oxygenase [Marichromatium gracile]MCF1183639.1 biliverdin-producing heme oxygenase [Marichromatium gracile]
MSQAPRPMSPPPAAALATALRQATAAAHRAVETLPLSRRLLAPDLTLDEYRDYLYRLTLLYQGLEPHFTTIVPDALRRRLGARPRLAALRDDLARLDTEPPAPHNTLPARLCAEQGIDCGIGALYVLEGSSLGGQLIARRLRARFGARFTATEAIDPYGAAVGARWRAFTLTLDALEHEGRIDRPRVLHGAMTVFADIAGALSLAPLDIGRARAQAEKG